VREGKSRGEVLVRGRIGCNKKEEEKGGVAHLPLAWGSSTRRHREEE